ncbi:adenosylcobinamide-GDP ribazoletransferase [Paenibacillus sp. NPDC058071]|uniref:adenosylcobinamide-GDP ribazoletransferase n=1 Tax=Paenibacillus sp. NPDC058071 TaxID=3346326 RepID=UPI0036D8C593
MVIRSLKRHGQALAAALQFLTRLPVPIRVPFEPEVLARSAIYFPIAGAVIGCIIAVACALLGLFMPALPAAVLLLALWTAMSGGLHLDGWMDTADGVLSHRSRERMLEIMKDSRVGAMGVIAAVLLLLFKFAVLTELYGIAAVGSDESSIVVFAAMAIVPAWSRWWMAAAIAGWPNARQGEGIGAMFRLAGWKHSAGGGLIAAAYSFIALTALGKLGFFEAMIAAAVAALVTAFVGWASAVWLSRKLGGLTGDTYGAMNEAVEAVLLLAALLWLMNT